MEVTNSIDRRKFLKITGISGAMLAIGFESLAMDLGEDAVVKAMMAEDFIDGTAINPFVIISEDGQVTIMATIPELGQGINQGIPAIIAEELEVDLSTVNIVKSSATRKYGRQSIGGSRNTRSLYGPMRKLGASTKEMFIKAAANRWGARPEQCYAKNGQVFKRGSDTTLAYSALVKDAASIEVPKQPKLKDRKDFQIIGKPLPRPDLALKVSGQADYGMDAQTEGLLYATIERCPTLQGTIAGFDESAAMAVAGVQKVMEVTRNVYGKNNVGIAVVASSYYAALQGRKALNIKWNNAEFTNISSDKIDKELIKLESEDGYEHVEKGDFKATLEQAAQKIEVRYDLPYLSHTCMEPMNATVHVKEDGTCEVWAPSQSPQIQRQFAKILGISEDQAEEKIKVHLPYLGGGFGRRSMNDSLFECLQISQAMTKPVKLIWSREDDTRQGPFRQRTTHAMKATFDANKKPIGLQHKMISQAITTQGRPGRGRLPFEVMEGINTHYDIPNISTRFVEYKNQIPIHWWRSVFGSTNGFAHEGFMDEIAIMAGEDPLQFRKDRLQSEPRFVKVLDRLEKEADWNKKLPDNQGKGLAIVESFGSIVGHAVFLKKENGKISIPKVVSVVDCGIYINPDQVAAQTEGNIIYGLTAALKDPITFKDGAAEQANFDTYRMLRMNEAPRAIEVHIMENDEAPGGMGEPGLPPIAPALANAVFDLSGKRIRKLPFDLQRV
ncbi:MAG: xanthine dehydrogenase family protein molybdopterin-binding subunit [Roseivirga sp.]